jgi:hypothetical protein
MNDEESAEGVHKRFKVRLHDDDIARTTKKRRPDNGGKVSKANKAKQGMPVQAERRRPAIFRHTKNKSKGTCKVVTQPRIKTQKSVAPSSNLGTGKPFMPFPFPFAQ